MNVYEYIGTIPPNRRVAVTAMFRGMGVREHRMHQDRATGAYSVHVRTIDVNTAIKVMGVS
jgi:hypothetical protein